MDLSARISQAMSTRPRDDEADMVISYKALQRSIGIIGFLLPLVLLGYAAASQAPLLGSMSAYYYARVGPYFVGSLFALGVFLYSYRYAPRDEWLSNLAGVFVVFVALCPTAPPGTDADAYSAWNLAHLAAAASFFVVLAYFAYALFPKKPDAPIDWLPPWPSSTREDKRDWVYRICGAVIVLALLASVLNGLLHWGVLFWCEAIAVWAFSAAWLVKGGLLQILADVT
ncbi:MAG: DUF998 domain-containing protein [Actinomycetia bacterium]|nr:DUF998 domain-containing protein [Actinomycetes bacterium]